MNSNAQPSTSASGHPISEDVELSGHIIDSLLLPKVLDEITSLGASIKVRKSASVTIETIRATSV